MNKLKFLTRSVVLLAAFGSTDVSSEYYVIQPGDALWNIANNKILKSHLKLDIEQVMLTIFKLNPDAFLEGDVNRLITAKRIYIPENETDFVQMSKREAQQRLYDKNYLRELYSTAANSLKLSGTPGLDTSNGSRAEDYTQVLQTLENHQHNIDILKIENAQLAKSFKLLERALGRIVIVQGLLTNDVVRVKSKLFSSSPNTLASAAPASERVSTAGENLVDAAPVILPKIGESSAKQDQSAVNPGAADVLNTPIHSSATLDNVGDTIAPAASSTQANVASEAKPAKVSNGSALVKNQSGTEALEGDFWREGAMAATILVPISLLLLWFLDFRQIRSKLKLSKAPAIGAAPKVSMADNLAASNNGRYAANITRANSVNDDLEPIRIKADKSTKISSLAGCLTELGGVLELLDMCILCGDYQQAREVTLRAAGEHQSSPVLAKKLAFIERKLA